MRYTPELLVVPSGRRDERHKTHECWEDIRDSYPKEASEKARRVSSHKPEVGI